MKTLILAEHNNQTLKPATLNVITAAQQLGEQIDVLVAGFHCETVAKEFAKYNIKNVLLADNEIYQYFLPENLSQLVFQLAKDYDYILVPATTFGKNILPRVAALLDVAQVSDVIKIIDKEIFVRPVYAGNALATVQTKDKIKLLTVRTTAFNAAASGNQIAPIKNIDILIANTQSQFVSEELTHSARPELTAAKIIISGGRGLQSAENFKLLEKIADKLNAAVGASRAAVDAGFVPNDYQVGQTGKVVAPDLYIAVGISGAIQHLAGMKDSKVIVAINKDPDAPIFQVADYGLVGDLFEILPQLENALKND